MYYLHVIQKDRFVDDYDHDGNVFSFKRVAYHGPFDNEQDALNFGISQGHHRMAYTMEVIEFG
jgi:hypothetical protein|tara:strand:+ start:55 stop:243 length:189 start_codon:yes stop_codon:yes gene_type:complete